MKKIFLSLMVLAALAIPLACSNNNNPTTPALTATPLPTATTWANYTATNTPISTVTSTATATNVTATATPSLTPTSTFVFNATNTFIFTMTFTTTNTASSTPTSTPFNNANNSPTPVYAATGPSVIQYPNGLAAGSNGNIYVAQGDGTSNSSVQILNSSLSSTGSITNYGGAAFGNLNGVATNSAGTTLYVVDSVNNAVYIFTSGGTTVASWGSWTGSSPNSFLNPEGIAVDINGNIYVADTGNDEVEEFSGPGTLVTEWSGGTQSFDNPSAVAVDGSNNLYVADASNQLVQKLNGSTWTSWSTSQQPFLNPSDVFGITVDNNGNVYIADVGNGLMEEYSNSGSLETVWNGPNNDFVDPDGVVILSGGNILITDYTGPNGTGSLQEFGP